MMEAVWGQKNFLTFQHKSKNCEGRKYENVKGKIAKMRKGEEKVHWRGLPSVSVFLSVDHS